MRAVESDVQDPAVNAGVDDRGDYMTVLAGDQDGERVDVARVCQVVPGFQIHDYGRSASPICEGSRVSLVVLLLDRCLQPLKLRVDLALVAWPDVRLQHQ